MPDNTLSTLLQIKTKIRRLTRSPSTAQISDQTLNDYINSFLLYDFPEYLQTFSLRTTLTFYLEPYIDTYAGDNIITNFTNLYTNIYENVYVAGNKQSFFQDRDQFFSLYPKVENISTIGVKGNGVRVAYGGTLAAKPVLRNHVLFSSVNTANAGLQAHDDGAGNLVGDVAFGNINYITGVWALIFTSAPANGATINSQTVPYVTGIPQAILYYNNELTFRPVPDQPYRVELEVSKRPTELLNNASMPELSQWWQYIAYGAAKKIFEDRMDTESIERIMPEFKQQEILINTRTILKQSKERTATIYTNIYSNIY